MRTRPDPGRPISEEGHVAVSEESKSSMSPESAEDAEEAADVVENPEASEKPEEADEPDREKSGDKKTDTSKRRGKPFKRFVQRRTAGCEYRTFYEAL